MELGYNVGGLTAELSRSFKCADGVDTSVKHSYWQRELSNNPRKAAKKYRIYGESNEYSSRSINIPRCENVEFVCASGANLPFRDKSIDAVCSSNAVDIVKQPMRLLQEKLRILRENGLFLMSDRYDFHPSRSKEFPGTVKKSAMEVINKAMGEDKGH